MPRPQGATGVDIVMLLLSGTGVHLRGVDADLLGQGIALGLEHGSDHRAGARRRHTLTAAMRQLPRFGGKFQTLPYTG